MSNWELPPKGGHMESPNGLYLQTMNMTQINERLKTNDLIFIPVGSTECHGAGQPLGEDTFLVTRMLEQVAMKMGCTIAHPIWYSSHPHNHLGHAGNHCGSRGCPAGEHEGHHHGSLEHGLPQADLCQRSWSGRGSAPGDPAMGRKNTSFRQY